MKDGEDILRRIVQVGTRLRASLDQESRDLRVIALRVGAVARSVATPSERCAVVDPVTCLDQCSYPAVLQCSPDTCGGSLPRRTVKHRATILSGSSCVESEGQHVLDGRLIASPASIWQYTLVGVIQLTEQSWPLAQELARFLHARLGTSREEALLRTCDSPQEVECPALIELIRDLKRGQVLTDRPRVYVIAAGRLLAVATETGSQLDDRRVLLKQSPQLLSRTKRSGQENVYLSPTLDQVLRQGIPSRTSLPLEHPLCWSAAVVDVSGIDISAVCEQQIDHLPGSGEVQRRLTVATSFVDARWILPEHMQEQIRSVELGRRACVGYRTSFEQSFGHDTMCRMQSMKAAGPPIAPAVGIGAEIEEHLNHREISRPGKMHYRG